MATQHFPLASSAIKNIWYDSATGDLWIEFNKVKTYPKYHFEGVPQKVVVQLLNATSAGNVYHAYIAGNYQSNVINGPSEDATLNVFRNRLSDKFKLIEALTGE